MAETGIGIPILDQFGDGPYHDAMQSLPARPSERADARANRARVLQAARELLREQGLAAEMKELAERADVGVGTIYRNFPSKADLVLAILKDVLATSFAEVATAEAMADPLEGLRHLLRCELALVEQYGWLFEALLSGQIPPRCRAAIREEMEAHHFAQRFERLLRRAVLAGKLREDLDVPVAAAMLTGTTNPMNRGAIQGRVPLQLADAILAALLRGAAPGERPAEERKGDAVQARRG